MDILLEQEGGAGVAQVVEGDLRQFCALQERLERPLRTTYWVLEDGEWLHRFSQEEIDSFMPNLSFEQFVAVQQ